MLKCVHAFELISMLVLACLYYSVRACKHVYIQDRMSLIVRGSMYGFKCSCKRACHPTLLLASVGDYKRACTIPSV
jgi:hypothetical protein